MTPKEAAAMLEISVSQLRHLMNTDPRLKWHQYSVRCIRLDEADVLAFKELCKFTGRRREPYPPEPLLTETLSIRSGDVESKLRQLFRKDGIVVKSRGMDKTTSTRKRRRSEKTGKILL